MAANNNLVDIARSRIRRRSLDTPIAGRGGYIDRGTHDVEIADVDLARLDSQGCIEFTFQDASAAKHSQRVWLLRQGADEYSSTIINLVNSLFQDPTVYELLDELISNPDLQEGTFQGFRGLNVRIHIDRSDGYTIDQQNGEFVIADAATGRLLDDRKFSKLTAARDAATAQNLKRSYRRVQRYEALDNVTLSKNRKSFDASVQGMLAAAKSIGNLHSIFDPSALRDPS